MNIHTTTSNGFKKYLISSSTFISWISKFVNDKLSNIGVIYLLESAILFITTLERVVL